jgi:hypothetical protein
VDGLLASPQRGEVGAFWGRFLKNDGTTSSQR